MSKKVLTIIGSIYPTYWEDSEGVYECDSIPDMPISEKAIEAWKDITGDTRPLVIARRVKDHNLEGWAIYGFVEVEDE